MNLVFVVAIVCHCIINFVPQFRIVSNRDVNLSW